MLIALLLSLASASELPLDNNKLVDRATTDILLTCKNRWPKDFRMQRFCESEAQDGFIQFMRIYLSSPKPLTEAATECARKWQDSETNLTDWNMAGFCAKEQKEAYDRP